METHTFYLHFAHNPLQESQLIQLFMALFALLLCLGVDVSHKYQAQDGIHDRAFRQVRQHVVEYNRGIVPTNDKVQHVAWMAPDQMLKYFEKVVEVAM